TIPLGSSVGRSVTSSRPFSLACNLCYKPLATTCFHCTCDCIFCEDCTYKHFEQNSTCPVCRRPLGENDFTELVVADSNGSNSMKSNMQALFSKKSVSGYLQFQDMCEGLIQQIDYTKLNTKFLLKQLIIESRKAGRSNVAAAKAHEALKAENTHLKQMNSSLRLQYEQTINDLQNKLKAREGTVSELNQMLNNFQKIHGARAGGGGGSGVAAPRMVPHSSSVSLSSGRGSEPPLRGLMAQREANMKAQQNVMNGVKPPFMHNLNANRSKSPGTTFHPFSSSNSGGSIGTGTLGSNAPRIRDLSANTGYHFNGMANQNMNKRRRGGTPTLQGTPTLAMSPNTAFALNQGPHGQNLFHRSG
ncbi:hypothetical protein ACHAXA_011289, partial [Cyclostephanos tholiformis]